MSITDTPSNRRFDETLAGTWQLDPRRSSVEFRAGHFWGLVAVKGRFDDYQGRLDLSTEPAIELTIDAASVHTANRKRDQHLRSADFFDAENNPWVRFVSDSVVVRGDTLRVHGHLFARGQSIPLDLDAQVRRIEGDLKIEAATTAKHRELGMTWSPLGMIAPRSELRVEGYLIPGGDRVAPAGGALAHG
jgi:polyisoprenoid-binding protein YceI